MMSTVSEKLLQVAQNNPKVYHSGQLNIVKNAECLKGSKSGSSILIDDISPVTHEMGVKVRGKNLIPYPFTYESTTIYGITFTDNKNGTITLNGQLSDNTAPATYVLFNGTGTNKLGLKPNTDYYLSCSDSNLVISLRTVKTDGTNNFYSYGNIRFSSEETPDRLFLQVKKNDTRTFGNTVISIQLELGPIATPYAPYISDLTTITVTRCGKNLFDKSIPISSYIRLDNSYKYLKYYVGTGTNVTVSIAEKPTVPNDNGFMYVYPNTTPKADANAKWLSHQTVDVLCSQQQTVVSTDGYICLVVSVARALDYYGNSIQLELGSKATAYEPYITPTEYIPTVDGVVSGITSLYPNTTLATATDGVLIDCEYYKDIDKTFNELTTSVALSGGDS